MNREEFFRKSQEFEQMFSQARQFTEELLRENERLRMKILEAQRQKQEVHTRSFDDQIQVLQDRIEQLETEKSTLEDQFKSADTEDHDFLRRHAEVEEQNNNLANLYISSYQLHSTLNLSEVMTIVKEILINLIGTDQFSIMLLDEHGGELVPVASEHMPETVNVRLGEGDIGKAALSGQTFLTSGPMQPAAFDPRAPLAAVPLKIKDQVIGAICIYRLMNKKEKFLPIDYELFTLLASQAATAIFSAQLYSRSERKLSTIQNFLELLTTP